VATSRRRATLLRTALVGMLLAATATTTLGTTAEADHRFPDVNDGSALAPAAAWALDQGIVTGFDDGEFRPAALVNRGQMVNWLWSREGSPAPLGSSPFTDLDPGDYAHDAATWASDVGVVSGYPDGRFRPLRPVSRVQVVTWLWRLADQPEPGAPSPFSDATGRAVAWAAEHGVADGYPDGTFKGTRNITRGHAVQWVFRASTLPSDPPPNVLMVLTDDQTLASMAVMPQTRALIGDAGTTFTQGISSFPLCCPARATHATGQYSHNHGVVDNDNELHPGPDGPVPGQGGYDVFDHTNTVATWMDALGYETSYVGKTLNDYNGATAVPPAPPGYDRWFGWLLEPTNLSIPRQNYFNFQIYEDPDGAAGPTQGMQRVYPDDGLDGGNDEQEYLTDVLRDIALDQLDELAADDDPWFLTYAPFAPHTGSGRTRANANPFGTAPAPRHLGALVETEEHPLPLGIDEVPNYPPQDNPAYNLIPQQAAPWVLNARTSPANPWNLVQAQDRNDPDDDLTNEQVQNLVTRGYRLYLESLLAVDEAVQTLVDRLGSLGQLDDTIVIFTSDNGFAYGEHGFFAEKNEPYEESLRVPLLVRGPGFPAGTTVDAPVADIDYAPTLVRATGAAPGLVMDGLALQDIAHRPEGYDDRAILINNWPTSTRPNSRIRHWEGVRTDRYTYLEVPETASVELYDRSIDPHQLDSVADDPAYDAVEAYFAGLLDQLLACTGHACDVRADPPEPTTP